MKSRTSITKEWTKLQKQEQRYLEKHMEKEDSRLNHLLEEKIPENLQAMLDSTFSKAFKLVFEKGTDIIEKTYDREGLENDYQVNEYATTLSSDRKTLKAFSKKAKGFGTLNTLVSGVSGIGLGVLGIGIPDIFLFTGMILKNIYQIALSYGFDYDSDDEKKYILLLIRGALSIGTELEHTNGEINNYIETGSFPPEKDISDCIKETSVCMSKELLYMKFLQGIPIVGAVGGAYDAVYMKRITKYAELKYRRRFYADRMK